MGLSRGTVLGSVEILGLLGAGGMGEVYRGRDTKLGRDVAVKSLPDLFAGDADRLARFEREAQVLGSLNHPNIASIYHLEERGSAQFLVLELVEGETLGERIRRGTEDAQRATVRGLPLGEALDISRQIAEALEAAHEQGVIHRDLKPANIKITASGLVKVLDFGLAKVYEPAGSTSGLSNSPTLSAMQSAAGVILGTAAYMSPEQARGKAVDKRADIWAFGCLLYEMLSGGQTFPNGETISDTLAGVLRGEPDWAALPASTPRRVRDLLERCLKKDPRQRLRDIGDARLEIEEARREPAPSATPTTPSSAPRSRRREYVLAATALAAIAAAAALALWPAPPVPAPPVVRFEVAPPAGTSFGAGQSFTYISAPFPSLSPDGRMLAYVATGAAEPQIWLRPMDATSAQPLRGTEGAVRPFWSPAGDFIAFFAQDRLKKIPIGGGPVLELARQVTGVQAGGTWSSNGTLLWAQNPGPLQRVSSAGGRAEAATTLDESRKEIAHFFPHFLPDGNHFTFVASSTTPELSGTFIGTLDSTERLPLPGIGSEAVYSPSGHLVFVRQETLMAQPFDLQRLQLRGEPFPIVEQVGANAVSGAFSVSEAGGALAYRTGATNIRSRLVWYDRSGREVGEAGPDGDYTNIDLSPDGKLITFQAGRPSDIWLLDTEKALISRVTSNPAADSFPLWSADGRSVFFNSNRDGGGIYRRAVGVIGADEVVLKRAAFPGSRSLDGRFFLFSQSGSNGLFDIWALPLSGDPTPVRATDTPTFHEAYTRLSPDGRWLAYASNESGRYEVVIQSFPGPGARQQVSSGGGILPQWSANSRELYFIATDSTLVSVALEPEGQSLRVGAPQPLFKTRIVGGGVYSAGLARQYAVAADGRFLIQVPGSDAPGASPITVILNWAAGLK